MWTPFLQQIDAQTWEIVQNDTERPTDLRHIARITSDKGGCGISGNGNDLDPVPRFILSGAPNIQGLA